MKVAKKNPMKSKATPKKKSLMKASKSKRVSVVAKGKRARVAVFSGRKQRTLSGLSKQDLVKSKTGKIVSKKASARAKKNCANSGLKVWADACKQARKALGVTGFVPVGGKSTQGKALYAKVKSLIH